MAAGATGALAMPPFGFAPAMILPMSVAVWLIDGAAGASRGAALRAAFADGWWWGFGYFLAGLWWLGAAFLIDAEQYLWAMPLAVVGLPMALALFPALGFALARAIWPPGAERALALGFGLSLSEVLRTHALTGFPWKRIRHGARPASVDGAGGGLCRAARADRWRPSCSPPRRRRFRRAPSRWRRSARWRWAGSAHGGRRRRGRRPVAGTRLRLVQPNVAEGPSFSAENGAAILGGYLKLSDRATSPDRNGVADLTHLFWPESAFPFILTREPGAMARIAEFLHGGATLVTGASREEDEGGEPRYYNSIEIIDSAGLSAARYDKRHLVPFGEYLPLRSMFDRLGLTPFVKLPGGFTPGVGRRALAIRGLPAALPMICYEAIFPNEAPRRTGDSEHVGYIVNLTDDAWFGRTAGPYQHFAQARLRTIELGLPMLRVANTGVSAVIDARGRVLDSAPLGVEAVIDAALPGALPATWQAQWGARPTPASPRSRG